MQFVADYWMLWGIGLAFFAIMLALRMISQVKNVADMNGRGIGGTIMFFIPVWAFGILFFLSLLLNIIQFAKGG
jgi:hypothetical protein